MRLDDKSSQFKILYAVRGQLKVFFGFATDYIVPERERGFVVLPDTRFPPAAVTQHERDRTREQKAKDWDVLEKIG